MSFKTTSVLTLLRNVIQELTELYDDSDSRGASRVKSEASGYADEWHWADQYIATNNGEHDDGCGESPDLIPCRSSVLT